MPCDTRLKPRQTIQQRAQEVREAVARLSAALAAGRVKVRVGPQGAIAFEGWDETGRDGITDNCAYRRIMSTGSAVSRMLIAQAEQRAGRSVNKQVIGQGGHYHGDVYHEHKG